MELLACMKRDGKSWEFYVFSSANAIGKYTMDELVELGISWVWIHGQFKFNFRHPAISRDQSKEFLDWAFRHDFERNGPSLFRVCRTTLQGWKRYKNHQDLRIRQRFCHEARALKWSYPGPLWAMERILRPTNERVGADSGITR